MRRDEILGFGKVWFAMEPVQSANSSQEHTRTTPLSSTVPWPTCPSGRRTTRVGVMREERAGRGVSQLH
jgi:hypothetical protein